MDLVNDSITWDAIMQSTIGRSQGIGKNSVCFFRKTYCQALLNFINNGCYDEAKKFGSRSEYVDSNGQARRRGRPAKHSIFIFHGADKV